MTSQFFNSSIRSLAAATVLFTTGMSAQAAYSFKQNDHIAVLGSGLAERMQYDGWLETVLQSELPKKELVFRNMAFPGDQIGKRPRSRGFMPVEQYLEIVRADVIFMFFGYNESFAGEAGLAKFTKDMEDSIDTYLALKPNGHDTPGIVLFSPIAHENLKTPNLPDGAENNIRLAMYTQTIRNIAERKNVTFVDLFSASQNLYDKSTEPLTINGIHLNAEGDRLLAEVIVGTLLDRQVTASADLENLREAVVDKSWYWRRRYRAPDGNDVWGGRSTLKFYADQTNREVLQHELSMIDIMTLNRDPVIWARANGGDLIPDDRNVPTPVPVISNVGGGSSMSSAMKEGSPVYLDGEEAIKKMTVADGFEINLFADEKRFPELVNPVQMAVDTKGRLWVAAWKSYPKWEPLRERGEDRLLIMPDENHDGVADRVITFAEVDNPTGFEFWNGGVLVAAAPNVWFLKDTDGDDVADVKYVYAAGIGSSDTHHAANAFSYGPDGGMYWQSGVFLVTNVENPYGPPMFLNGLSCMTRFNPRTFSVNMHAVNSPNPHGVVFDYWGYHYANDGTGGRAYQVRPEGSGFKMHSLLKKEVRPVAASGIISSANFPDDMQGNYILANTIGYLGIKNYSLDRDPETGHVWGEPDEELLVSSDKNFRPSDVEFGADGALYISDWQNIIVGHMQHNVRDPNRDHKHGRIYRMVNTRKPLQKPVKIAGAPLDQLMKNLENPVDGVRYRTRIELSGRKTKDVLVAVDKWMEQFDSNNRDDAHSLLEALWLKQQHNVRDPQLLAMLLNSPEPQARIAARTVQQYYGLSNPVPTPVVSKKKKKQGKEEHAKPAQKSGVISDSANLTVIRVGTVVEKMRYDITEFTVKAGKKLKITFSNVDFMPHNFVIVKPGKADEVGMAAMQLGAKGFEMQFVPKNDNIIIATGLVDKDEEKVLEFTAPSKPGDYQFVCTFPGHHILMRGVMHVTR